MAFVGFARASKRARRTERGNSIHLPLVGSNSQCRNVVPPVGTELAYYCLRNVYVTPDTYVYAYARCRSRSSSTVNRDALASKRSADMRLSRDLENCNKRVISSYSPLKPFTIFVNGRSYMILALISILLIFFQRRFQVTTQYFIFLCGTHLNTFKYFEKQYERYIGY